MSLRITSLQRALAMTTLLTCILAHSYRYRSGYIFKRPQIIEEKREEPEKDRGIQVACPVCPGDRCEINSENKFVKRCKYGIFLNEQCDNRMDCYQGPEEYCDDELVNSVFICAPGMRCVNTKCEGGMLYNIVDNIHNKIDYKMYYNKNPVIPRDNSID